MEIRVKQIIEALGGKIAYKGDEELLEKNITRVITDSREFKDGIDYKDAVFACIVGERFDGNDFALDVAKHGVALIATTMNEEKLKEKLGSFAPKTWFVTVEDSLKTLGLIAKCHRQKFNPKTVGITGSVGKTTTKEVIYHMLAENFRTLKTEASYNNEIGVPRTLMTIDENVEALVVEMGMRGFHQVEFLADVSMPQVGVVTNIGCPHLEIMKTKENTLKAKLEMAKQAGTMILNGDDQLLSNSAKIANIFEEYGVNPKIIYFGFDEKCDIMGKISEINAENSVFDVFAYGEKLFTVTLNAPGTHNVSAALAGVAVCLQFGIAPEMIKKSLESFKSEQIGRQKIEKLGEVTVIDDCFNAGPESMKASLSLLKALDGKRKVAFLGDMLELGDVSKDEHKGVGVFAAKNGVDLLITVGERAKDMGLAAMKSEKGTSIIALDDSKAAAEAVNELIKPGDVILVKGSHAMEMGIIVEAIKNIKF